MSLFGLRDGLFIFNIVLEQGLMFESLHCHFITSEGVLKNLPILFILNTLDVLNLLRTHLTQSYK